MATLNVTEEQLNAVIAGAILQSLTPEKRDELLRDAVASLMVPPPKDSWGPRPKAPLLEAFERAAVQVANGIVRDLLANDAGFKAQVTGLITAAVEKAMVNRDEISDRLAQRLGDLLTNSRE